MDKLYSPALLTLLLRSLVLCGFGIVSIQAGQDINWDLLNYHFYVAHALIENRLDVDIVPAQLQTFINPLIDLPFYLGVHVLRLPPIVIGFCLGVLHGINALLAFELARNILARLSIRPAIPFAFLATFVGMSGAATQGSLGNTMGDGLVSIFILAGLLKIFTADTENSKSTSAFALLVAGIWIGLGTGLKLTQSVYLIGSFAPVAFVVWRKRNWIAGIAAYCGGLTFGIFASLGFWAFQMWSRFQNPLFPFFNAWFRSPYYFDWSVNIIIFLPRALRQFLFQPFSIAHGDPMEVSEVSFDDWRWAVAYVLLLIWLSALTYRAFSRKLTPPSPVLVSFISFYIISYLFWQRQFSYYRYLVVLEILCPLLIILILHEILPRRQIFLWATALVFAILLLTVRPLSWGRLTWGDSYFGVSSLPDVPLEKALVLMFGFEPTGYLIPYFPPEAQFVRVESSFSLPRSFFYSFDTAVTESKIKGPISNLPQWDIRVKKILSRHSGPLYSLYQEGGIPTSRIARDTATRNQLLRYYGLQQQECYTFTSKITQYNLCKVVQPNDKNTMSLSETIKADGLRKP